MDMIDTNIDIDVLSNLVAKKVMRIVNKHHGDLQKHLASYRANNIEIRQKYYQMSKFNLNQESIVKRLNEVQKMITDYSIGLQRVYDKFTLLEEKQIEIENLLKSPKIYELIKKIPTENDIDTLLDNIGKHKIGKIDKAVSSIQKELENLSSLFCI